MPNPSESRVQKDCEGRSLLMNHIVQSRCEAVSIRIEEKVLNSDEEGAKINVLGRGDEVKMTHY